MSSQSILKAFIILPMLTSTAFADGTVRYPSSIRCYASNGESVPPPQTGSYVDVRIAGAEGHSSMEFGYYRRVHRHGTYTARSWTQEHAVTAIRDTVEGAVFRTEVPNMEGEISLEVDTSISWQRGSSGSWYLGHFKEYRGDAYREFPATCSIVW